MSLTPSVQREKKDPSTSSISGTSDTVDGGLQDHRIPTFAAMVVLRIHFNLNLCGVFALKCSANVQNDSLPAVNGLKKAMYIPSLEAQSPCLSLLMY